MNGLLAMTLIGAAGIPQPPPAEVAAMAVVPDSFTSMCDWWFMLFTCSVFTLLILVKLAVVVNADVIPIFFNVLMRP